MLSSLSDETPEGRSIVVLAKERYGFSDEVDPSTTFIPFSAMTRMSGVDLNGAHNGDGAAQYRYAKGLATPLLPMWQKHGGTSSDELKEIVDGIARAGSTPLVVAETKTDSDGSDGAGARAGGDRTQRHRQGWHARALRSSCGVWASARS